MSERVVAANGLSIWTEDFGSPEDPTILLVMGASAQAIVWPEEFCEALAAAGRHVIRYDNRDTGQSTCVDFSAHPYTAADLAADAIGVLDAYGVAKAHVVGASLGGAIVQTMAIDYPDRVLTLTSIMSTPGGGTVAKGIQDGTGSVALPGPEPKVIQAMTARLANPPTTREERIEAAVQGARAVAGTMEPFDEAAARKLETRVLERATNPDAGMNHALAAAASPDRFKALAGVTAPTLVIHGTADPILPFAHGEATAKAIPGAQLLPIEGMGHDLPKAAQSLIVDALVSHTR